MGIGKMKCLRCRKVFSDNEMAIPAKELVLIINGHVCEYCSDKIKNERMSAFIITGDNLWRPTGELPLRTARILV